MKTRSISAIVGSLILAVTGPVVAQMSADGVLQPTQQSGGGSTCQSGYTSIRASNGGGMVCLKCPTGYKAPEYTTILVNHADNGYAVCVACRKGTPAYNPATKGYICR